MSCLVAPGGRAAYKPPQRRDAGFESKPSRNHHADGQRSKFATKRQHDNHSRPPPAQRLRQAEPPKKSDDYKSVLSRHPLRSSRLQSELHQARTGQDKRSAAIKRCPQWRPGDKSLEAIPESQPVASTNKILQVDEAKTETPESKTFRGLESRWSRVMSYRNCYEGMIIRSAVHEVDYQNKMPESEVDLNDRNTVQTTFGLVHSKLRWQVIVSKKPEHYITVPLYTHDGKGLLNKKDEIKFTYLSIRDQRQQEELVNLTPHDHIDAVMLNGTTILKPESVVRVTYPLNGKYDLPVEVLGRLPEDSLESLKALYNQLNKV